MSPAGAALHVDALSEIAGRYDLVLCDVWGVLHDGLAAFPAAAEALAAYRQGGGRVILISNAPRPGRLVREQLEGPFGVRPDAFDAILTSGDLTREIVKARGARPYAHIGPARDAGLFAGLAAGPGALAEAEYAVCTGLLDDESETIADYDATLREMRARGLEMICANPDIVVERGARLILCAGALGQAYEALGGPTLTPGKPYRPIYEAALAKGRELMGDRLAGRALDPRRVLAVGDAIRTDIVGGHGFGLDTLLVARGIHAGELGMIGDALDREAAMGWLGKQAAMPTWMMRELA